MTGAASPVLRCGMASIVGRPNVGKSTLLNKIVGEKIAIVSKVPQTTRNQVRGVYTDERGQIVFIDTPGVHMGRDQLDKMMNQSSVGTVDQVDCVIYLVDTSRRIGQEEHQIAEHLKDVKRPLVLGLNKIDLKGNYLPEYIEFWEKAKGCPVAEMKNFTLMPLSSAKGTNVDKLIEVLFENLPAGDFLYPEDIVCDMPRKMVVADIIREKFFDLMKDELPHALGVVVESIQPRKGKTLYVKALVFVERDSQKEIVIGKGGSMLKKAGTLARKELEELLESRVFLELFVKAHPRWRDDPEFLRDLGYSAV